MCGLFEKSENIYSQGGSEMRDRHLILAPDCPLNFGPAKKETGRHFMEADGKKTRRSVPEKL